MLIDTSVWIEYLDRANAVIAKDVEELLRRREAAIAGIILAEIRQGCRKAGQVKVLITAFEPVTYIEADRGAWLRAGEIVAEGLTKGVKLHLGDCLVAALALRENCSIFSLDNDFERIPGLSLHHPRRN